MKTLPSLESIESNRIDDRARATSVRARNLDETIDKTSTREFHRRARPSRDETVSRAAERPPDRSAVAIRRIRARAFDRPFTRASADAIG